MLSLQNPVSLVGGIAEMTHDLVALDLFVRNEKGVGTGSPCCSSNCDQSIVRPSRRGGVPVLRRVQASPRVRSWAPSVFEGASPFRPQLYFCSPT